MAENNRSDVYELQTYLRTIQLVNGATNLLNPDGIYGRETTEAVMSFQIANNIPATGRVDSRTWERIFEEYLIAEEKLGVAEGVRIFPLGIAEMKKGDSYDEIYVLQVLLRKNENRLNMPALVSLSGVFDDETEAAVKEIQRIFGVEQTGIVNKQDWNRLARYHNVKYLSE